MLRFFCSGSYLDILKGPDWVVRNPNSDLTLGRWHGWTGILSTHQGVALQILRLAEVDLIVDLLALEVGENT